MSARNPTTRYNVKQQRAKTIYRIGNGVGIKGCETLEVS